MDFQEFFCQEYFFYEILYEILYKNMILLMTHLMKKLRE